MNEQKEKRKALRRALIAAASVLIWIIIWELGALIVHNELILPSPVTTVARLFSLAATIGYWRAVGLSILNISIGLICGIALGVIGGTVCGHNSVVRALFSPILTVVRATPVASFIMLVYIWLSKNALPGFISFLMVLPVVWTAVERGVLERDRKLLEAAKVFSFGRKKVLKYITLPSVRPYFIESLRTSAGLAWKAGIAAEVLVVAKTTIGGMLYDAKIALETTDVFAWTLSVIIISLVLEAIIKAILDKKKAGEM